MPSSKGLASIVMAAYNAAPYIRETVESALAQTYKSVEIIVVDDGSTDGTREVLAPYIERNAITYIRQENKGPSAARNVGIAHSRGEFIAFLDADDIFMPEKVEKQVGYLAAHPECGVSYCGVRHFEDTHPERLMQLKGNYYSGKDVLPGLLGKNFIITLSVVLRRSAIDMVGGFDESFRRSEDWELWFRLAHHGVQFSYLPEVLAECRLHAGSLSRGSDGWETRVKERRSVLRLVKMFYDRMTPEERRRTHADLFIWEHRLKLWYVVIGNRFPPLRWLSDRIQARRWE
jgi:glycosyltransferase involved in cell wall biosynthesis